ncbi:hypothetical protein F2P81_015619 [Scophthalmus maximus]|uniref:Uncharacterized protein n=1 Tax=Scophthalmus maximus TaxID=52904 RepID=A0A6A4SJB2_SCOMX|nr:hypothetical protein F2P81_015619 [Scophthalmus maximus]
MLLLRQQRQCRYISGIQPNTRSCLDNSEWLSSSRADQTSSHCHVPAAQRLILRPPRSLFVGQEKKKKKKTKYRSSGQQPHAEGLVVAAAAAATCHVPHQKDAMMLLNWTDCVQSGVGNPWHHNCSSYIFKRKPPPVVQLQCSHAPPILDINSVRQHF